MNKNLLETIGHDFTKEWRPFTITDGSVDIITISSVCKEMDIRVASIKLPNEHALEMICIFGTDLELVALTKELTKRDILF